jgi:hypothetical protein
MRAESRSTRRRSGWLQRPLITLKANQPKGGIMNQLIRRKGGAAVVAVAAIASLAGAADAQQAVVATPTARHSAVEGGVKLIPLPSPRHFVRQVTNRYYPLKPGTKWVYEGADSAEGERIVVRVLARTKQIQGITATVVSDRVTLDGELIEMTHDWYAQDDRGRVWYLGEATTSYDDGVPSREGSWMVGRDGARAGVVMFPRGRLNQTYYQEFLAGEAEDQGTLLDRSARVVGPTGSYQGVRITKDTTPLEPSMFELKFYAPGVGMVLELGTSPEIGRVELVSFTKG